MATAHVETHADHRRWLASAPGRSGTGERDGPADQPEPAPPEYEPVYGLPRRAIEAWLARNPRLRKEYEEEWLDRNPPLRAEHEAARRQGEVPLPSGGQ